MDNFQQLADRQRVNEDLQEIKEVFDKAGIKFFLMAGTLLGAIREKDFIKWDNDIEIGVFGNDRFELIIEELKKRGFGFKGKLFREKYFSLNFIRNVEIDVMVFFETEKEMIMVYGRFAQPDGKWQYTVWKNKKMYFENLKEIEFKGAKYLIPDCAESALAEWYGKWRTPAKGNCFNSGSVPLVRIEEDEFIKLVQGKSYAPPMNILFIHNATGSRIYRILPQAYYMASQGNNIKVRGLKSGPQGGIPDTDLQWADMVVVEMVYSPSFINACHKAGAKIIYELDDRMERVPPTHFAFKEMNWWRTFLTYLCLYKADAMTTTSEVIKRRYRWFNQDITVLPNYYNLDFWLKPQLPNTSDTIRLLWAGGNSHKMDLQFIAPVIKKILNKYKNVKFICCGFGGTASPDKWVKYNYGEGFFEDLPPEQYEFSLGAPMEVWPSKLNSLRGDIAIAPVVEEPFSRCKSECKFGEYALNKVAGVYSEFLYKSVKNGITGLVAKENHKDWFDKISFLIENEKQRKIMAQNAYEWVIKEWDFEKHAHKWAELYQRIADK